MTGVTRLTAALSDRYIVERELGGGGMSRVFVAKETALNRTVVIKVLNPGLAEGLSAERFAREIQLAASLQQANIVPLLTAGSADGIAYYVMPFVPGESLRGRLAQEARLPITECIGILRDVARALSYAHEHGVVHRDIKPDNVLLSHGAAMVTDFGIAKAVSAARTLADGGTLTQVGTSLGTPAYMSPEQVAGDPEVDHRADIYAWGCLAYELLTGTAPLVRENAQRTLAAHLTEAPLPISPRRPETPPALERLVLQSLAKEPAARPATARDLLTALDTVLTPAGAPSQHPGATPSPRRRGLLLLGTGVAVVAAAVFLFARGRTGSPSTLLDRSVAVLPLTNLSGDKADDYFGVGLSEELTRALTKAGVRVIGRVSAGALQAKGLDERAIARELGVGSLLTGSVQRAGDQIRIQISLLAATDGAVRWTEKYDRPLTNVFAVQDEIARSVAGKLLGSLGVVTAPTRNETSDPEAHALFLQGQVLFNRRTTAALQQSIALLQRAALRDTTYARAWGMLAMAYSVLPAYRAQHTDSARSNALAAADRAIRIDTAIAEAYTAKAYVHLALGNNHLADSLFRRSLALDSTVATTWGWYGLLAMHLGDYRAADARSARAREYEPASSIVQTWEAQAYLAARRYAAADSVASLVIGRDSTFALGWVTKANALINLGRAKEAIAILERRVAELPPGQPTETQALLAYACARAGEAPQARAVLATMQRDNGGRYPPIGTIAAALDVLGDRTEAVAVLGDAFADHDLWLVIFSRTERYDPLRKDPRTSAMFARSEAW